MFLRKQNLKIRLLAPILMIVVIFTVILYICINNFILHLVKENLSDKVQSKYHEIIQTQKEIQRSLLERSAMFTKNKKVIDAFQIAHTGDISNEKDIKVAEGRERLKKMFSQMQKGYKSVLSTGSLRIHFHLPSVRSFLRIWQDKQNRADDLSSFRNTVKEISAAPHKPIQGIEIGRGGFAIRGIAPIFDENKKYLGSVESLSSYDPVVKYAVSGELETIAVFMKKKYLPIAKKLQNQDKNPIVGDNFVFVSSTNKKISDKFISQEILMKGSLDAYEVRRGNFYIGAFPIRDYSDTHVGVLVYIYNAKKIFDMLRLGKIIILIGVIIFVLSISIVLFLTVFSITKSLTEVINLLSDKSLETDESTQRISEVSQKLAESTTEQAASLEETSSSLEEIKAMTSQNAKNSMEAEAVAQQAGQSSEKGNEMMVELEKAMDDIGNSSNNITKILKTIEEIAFQTNLLALNATVEAARAGEHGKGFAVVADEVRNLAQRVSKAAKDTSDLIKNNIEKSKRGVEISSDAVNFLGAISKDINKVIEIISSISRASKEQEEGISQITTAVTQIDSVTQQNAASAEESSATVQQLSECIKGLNNIVMDLRGINDGT